MSYIGVKPANVALTASDITDGIISLAKMTVGTDGNLITYDTSGNPAAVATGTSGHFLKSQGADSVPVFAAPAAGGKVGQVVQTTKVDTTSQSGDSGSWYDTAGMSVAITPAATSSKILVFLDTKTSQKSGYSCNAKVQRLIAGGAYADIYVSTSASGNQLQANWGTSIDNCEKDMFLGSYQFLDSPSTTSACTYKMQWMAEGVSTNYLNRSYNDGNYNYLCHGASSITVMEILA